MLVTHARRTNRIRSTPHWLAACLAILCLTVAVDSVKAAENMLITRTNGDLLRYCRTTVDTFSAARNGRDVVPDTLEGSWDLAISMGVCQGFIEGYRDAMDVASRSNTSITLFNLVCLSDTTTTEELAAAFVSWANSNPLKDDESSSMGIYRAWRQAWPCSMIVQQ